MCSRVSASAVGTTVFTWYCESLVTELRDAVMSCWIYLDRSLRGGSVVVLTIL